jgi:branched-chain amino acid transport system permease protein
VAVVQEQKRRERLDRGIKVRAESIYALASIREMAYLLAPRMILILGLLLSPLLVQNLYWQRVIGISAVYALLALSFDFLANYVGLVSLGGALFTGVGAYIAGILNSQFGIHPLITLPLATLIGAMASTFFLMPVLPLRGVYFAIATLMYPLLFERIIAATNILGGTEGLTGLDGFPALFLENYLPIAGLFIALFGLRRLVSADIGLVFQAIKDNDQSVRASGLNVTSYRARAVFIASAIGCFAGAYLSHLYSWAGMSSFALDFSILPIAATVVGGPGSLAGPVLGSFLLSPLSEALRSFGTLRIVFYALVIVLFIVFRSEGILNYLQRKYEQFEHWVEV